MPDKNPAKDPRFFISIEDIRSTTSNDYELHRLHSSHLSELVLELGDWRRAEKIRECGTYLLFGVPSDYSEKPFLRYASFCKDRLCPMCGWRKSLKTCSQVSQVMDVIQNDYRFIFVTLTLRNVDGFHLIDAIDSLSESFHLFMKYKECRSSFRGYYKALEITKNIGRFGMEYHPHLHIIFAVDKKNYFHGDEYLSHQTIRELWRKALRCDYAPLVNVKAVKDSSVPDGQSVSYVKAVLEVTKYTLKSADLFKGDHEQQLETVKILSKALRGRRLCSFGGIFKKVWHDLNLPDPEETDLTDEDKIRSDVFYFIFAALWEPRSKHYEIIFKDIEGHLRKKGSK